MWAIQPGAAQAQRDLPSGAPFSPLNLSPVFGVDAFSLSGSPVSSWADLSTGAHDATQATGARQPTWSATAFNTSYPGVTFDGAGGANDDFLRTVSFTLVQPFHIVMACNLVVTTGFAVLIDGVSPGAQTALYQAPAGSATQYAGSNGATKALSTTPHVISALFNGASSRIAIDNGSTSTGNPGTNGPGGVTLGADISGGSGSNMIIAACWIFSSALAAGDETTLVRYLGTRYGITVA